MPRIAELIKSSAPCKDRLPGGLADDEMLGGFDAKVLEKDAGIHLPILGEELPHLVEQLRRRHVHAAMLDALQRRGGLSNAGIEALQASEYMRDALKSAIRKRVGAEAAHEIYRGAAIGAPRGAHWKQISDAMRHKFDPRFLEAAETELLGMKKVAIYVPVDELPGVAAKDIDTEFSAAIKELERHHIGRRAAAARAAKEVAESVEKSFAKTMGREVLRAL